MLRIGKMYYPVIQPPVPVPPGNMLTLMWSLGGIVHSLTMDSFCKT
jgi:hypothetical protein